MLRSAVPLLLSATIVGCPFFCRLNVAFAQVGADDTRPCCDCCHNEKAPRPNDSDHCPRESGKTCQCICGGAVSEVGGAPDVGLDTSLWSALPVEALAAPTVASAACCVSISQLQPDDGSNVGRAMRCLFMSFLC